MTLQRGLYDGREQTYIKHLFLTQYLKDAAFKIFQGRSRVFNFVDGFAGPWETSTVGALEDTSFSQSIKVLTSVKNDLQSKGITGLKIRFYFCEKDSSAFAKLSEYARQQSDVEILLYPGRFEDNLDEIARAISGGFTFTFIDPTGFKVENAKIAGFLKTQRGEFLFNFMSEHINRYPDFEGVRAAYSALLADEGWRSRYDALPDTLKNEERILAILKEAFVDLKAAKYIADFGVMNPRKDRMQMRLVLGSNSDEAIELFRKTHRRVELSEIETRQSIAAGNQVSLFSNEFLAEGYQKSHGFGSAGQKAYAEELIVRYLTEHGATNFRDLWVHILVDAAVTKSIVKDTLSMMRKNDVVSFTLPEGKKKVQPDTLITLTAQLLPF